MSKLRIFLHKLEQGKTYSTSMKSLGTDDYEGLVLSKLNPSIYNNELFIKDHLNGFDNTYSNCILEFLSEREFKYPIITEYILSDEIREKYKSLDLRFSAKFKNSIDIVHLQEYNIHPDIKFNNFLCSFNKAGHVSRELLVSVLHKFRLFNLSYCSKYFQTTNSKVVGHFDYLNLTDSETRLYSKFITSDSDFLSNINLFGEPSSLYVSGMSSLENKLTQSFVHLVSESMASSNQVFITEKFLYSIITRGLFVTYGQPHWHSNLYEHYGFKKYDKIFDYSFDEIKNPMERLIKLISMVHKFSLLSVDDWNDLYQMESDTIEYNYDHYFSNGYLKQMRKYGL